MALVVEGHGFTVAHGELSITQNPVTIEVPGYSRSEIDRTTQSNSAVKTADVGTLRDYETFTHTFPYDPVDVATWEGSTSNLQHTITFPDSAGTWVGWAKVLKVGATSEETDGRPTYDVEFKLTNLNGSSEETVPLFTAGS